MTSAFDQRPGVLHHTDRLVIGRHNKPMLPAWSQTFAGGELWVVFGANGSGKSTLMQTLSGLLSPISGSHALSPACRRSGMLQKVAISSLLPITVAGIVDGGLDERSSVWKPRLPGPGRAKATRWLERFELNSLASRSFHQLSGGQRQRAFLARTLVSESNVVLLDEPTSAMDRAYAAKTYRLLVDYVSDQSASVLVATHDLELALPCASHAIFVDQETQTLLTGSPEDLAYEEVVQARYGNHIHQILSRHA